MNSLPFRRVVCTGLGIVSPVGVGVQSTWDSILSSRSGVRALQPHDLNPDTSSVPSTSAPVPPEVDEAYKQLRSRVVARVDPQAHRASPHFDNSAEGRRNSGFMTMALTAASEALSYARWRPNSEEDRERTGVFIGAGMSSPLDFLEASSNFLGKRVKRISPYFVPKVLPNMAAGAVSMRFGITGPQHAVSTACATGAHAIGDAFRAVQRGDVDVALAGGTDSCIDALTFGGFSSLRALSSRFNDSPGEASRPFDRRRDGFVLAEGAAVLILEDLEHALKRGAVPLAEIRGYGMSSDAHHITQPSPGGQGALRAMRAAFRGSGLGPEDVDYVNAHATSTPQGDEAEQQAIASLFGSRATDRAHPSPVLVSSTKGATGHMLGAAGAAEALFCILALRDRVAPPTLNLEDSDPALLAHLVGPTPRRLEAAKEEGRPRVALTNSFGFGGTNCSLLISSFER